MTSIQLTFAQTFSMSHSLRLFCYEPSGQLLSLPISLASALLGMNANESVVIPSFARCTVKFAQFVVELHQRKPVALLSESYYVHRFDQIGAPDSKRYLQEITAKFDSNAATFAAAGVIDASNAFASRGREWTPSRKEKSELHLAALGDIRVSRFRRAAVQLVVLQTH